MFKNVIEFDEKKAFDDGILVQDLYDIVDCIFEEVGIPKVSQGVHEDPDCNSSWPTIKSASMILRNDLIKKYCSKWEGIDPSDGYEDVRAMLIRKGSWKQ